MSFPVVEVESAAGGGKGLWFGRYQRVRILGYGASAKVYEAKDMQTNENVAIKVMSKNRLSEGGLDMHVKSEISAMRRLRHPNIVRLHHVLATKTKIYFVMELIKGGELFSKIRHSRLSEELCRRYFQQLISVLSYCHIRGVFHRDIKPENILFDDSSRQLKVSDFGLSAVKDQAEAGKLLKTLCGTPSYVAPEVLSKGGYDGAKADIWSCGVVLFVLNAGYLPFKATNTGVLYDKTMKGNFNVPRWTSPGLKHLLTRLLDPNPETRITLEEIFKEPWFQHKFEENVEYHQEDYDARDFEEMGDTSQPFNAFDIISSTVNLSRLFGAAVTPNQNDQLFSRENPETIMEKVEEVAKELNLRVSKKKEWAVRLEGVKGHLIVAVKLHPLTDELIVVEVRNKGRDLGSPWAHAFSKKLASLIEKPGDRAYFDYHVASS